MIYKQSFELREAPFSVTPDPKYVFMSFRHRSGQVGTLVKKWFFRKDSGNRKPFGLASFAMGAIICWLVPAAAMAQTITYVQGDYSTPQTPQSTVNVAFPAPQTAGNLNVVAVGSYYSAATVASVTDSLGNIYVRAVGPTAIDGWESQSIYYARNIAAAPDGSNTVTVSFDSVVDYSDIRILEYAGADRDNPVDVVAASAGSDAISDSGPATTTTTNDLIFGALITSSAGTPGPGFTNRLLTNFGNIAEDQMVAATGAYNATATVSPGAWIMQMVAFRATGSGVPGPGVSLSSLSLDFGNQLPGTSSGPQLVTLRNTGAAPLVINSIAVSGGNATDFAQTNDCGASIDPNNFCTIRVMFTPSSVGPSKSAVVITDNAAGGSQTIVLIGTGTGLTAPGLTLTSLILDFGNQPFGTPSEVHTLTLTSTGTAPLVINAIALSGDNAGDFSQATDCGPPIDPNNYCTIRVIFTPSSVGARSPVMLIADNAPGSPQTIALIGTGIEPSRPTLTVSSLTLDFGVQPSGTSSGVQKVTLTNTGTAPLLINSIALSGGNVSDFVQTTFPPSYAGIRRSGVVISSNAPGSPQTIALSGTGAGTGVSPSVSVLTFTMTQQFTATGGDVAWSVDGVVGGSPSSGTITGTGLYTPPNSTGTHTVTATSTSSGQSANATVYVSNYAGTFTHHNDNSRTGVNPNETVLTPANVNQAQFGELFSYPIDGLAFASPLYVANVNVPGSGFHNVVYVATEHDSVYAFDADGLSSAPLWQVSLLNGGTTVPCIETSHCADIPNEIGITGTPVIDPVSGIMYVVAKTGENFDYVQRLHALDITTGAEVLGGPVVLQATAPGGADGTDTVAFNPLRENQRPGLLLSNGVVYVGFGSHGDVAPYHGWILGYDAKTLQRVMAYNSTPNGNGGGIWQSGAGLSADATGNLYFATGNGDFDADAGNGDYSQSIEKISPGGSVLDYFTPYDYANDSDDDIDLGSGGPVVLVDQPGPKPHLLVSAGKTGTIYVLNRDNMGHYNKDDDGQIPQSLINILPNAGPDDGNFSAPVYFNGNIYICAANDFLKAFQLNNGRLSITPTSQSYVTYPNRGAAFAISASGGSNGILWATQDNPDHGVIRAYDASNMNSELYNSDQAGSRDALDLATKFSIPLVANGKVFVVTQTRVVAYGLLP